jgi:hypothetical protein
MEDDNELAHADRHLHADLPTAIDKSRNIENFLKSSDMASSTSALSRSERELARMRKKRKIAAITDDFVPIETDSCVPRAEEVHKCYDAIIVKHSSPITCFHVFLNSLRKHFAEAGDTKTEASTSYLAQNIAISKFLCDTFFVKTSETLQSQIQTVTRRLLEHEVMCLLEVFLLTYSPKPLKDTNLAKKLRYIYAASDAERLKEFMDLTLCDEFSEIHPIYLAGLYDELCMEVPLDLQRFEPQETWAEDDNDEIDFKENNALSLELQELLSETMEDSANGFADNKNRRRSTRRASTAMKNGDALLSAALQRPQSPSNASSRRKLAFLPETPEEKLRERNSKKRPTNSARKRSEVVEQTPVGKMKKSNSRESAKLAELLKQSERPNRKRSAVSYANAEPFSAKLSRQCSISSNSTCDSQAVYSFALAAKRSAARNLGSHFSSMK